MEDEMIIGCLGGGEQQTDYILCEGDVENLPELYEKDEIRYSYNQANQSWSKVSCTIFSAFTALSNLINHKFTLDEIKEVDEMSYERGRVRGQGWYTQSAYKLVADWFNASKYVKEYGKVAYYRVSKYDDKVVEDILDKRYTLGGNGCITTEYSRDYRTDANVEGCEFGNKTNGHAFSVIKDNGKRSVQDSYDGRVTYDGKKKCNVFGLDHKLSEMTNYGPNWYVYTLVREDNLEEIKRLNAIKSECNLLIEELGKLRHMVNDSNFQGILHYTAEKLRTKIEDANRELAKF